MLEGIAVRINRILDMGWIEKDIFKRHVVVVVVVARNRRRLIAILNNVII